MDYTSVGKALWSKLTGTEAIIRLMPDDRACFMRVPADPIVYPYIRYWLVTNDMAGVFSKLDIETSELQVDYFTDRTEVEAVAEGINAIRSALDLATLTFADGDYTSIYLRRLGVGVLQEERIQHGIVRYEMTLQETTA